MLFDCNSKKTILEGQNTIPRRRNRRYSRWIYACLATLLLTVILERITRTPLSSAQATPVKQGHAPHFVPPADAPNKLAPLSIGSGPTFSLRPTYSSTRTPVSGLELVHLSLSSSGRIITDAIPGVGSTIGRRLVARTRDKSLVIYSIDPALQKKAEALVRSADSKHAAIVMMNPLNGEILALAQKSSQVRNLALHAELPAASLFKLITTAAAIDTDAVYPSQPIKYRGGLYTLNQWNYKPSTKDNRVLPLNEALGKSCNPVFSRVALAHLDRNLLQHYAENFGFNENITFDLPLSRSQALIPSADYELGRTAAGFGKVTLSPVHAATLMSAIANQGRLIRPSLIDRVSSAQNKTLFEQKIETIGQAVKPSTAYKMLRMMETTTTTGTSRKEFVYRRNASLKGVRVAGKTGTLRGTSPEGINHWFLGAAPIEKPEIVVATIVIHPGKPRISASRIAREMLEEHFRLKKG